MSIRLKGRSHTLLPNEVVRPNGKRVTRHRHSCRASTLTDLFSLATKGRWSGACHTGRGFESTRILGETDSYTRSDHWYGLFVNNRAASAGLGGLKITRGLHVLLAAGPDIGTAFPTGITAPRTAPAAKAFTMHVALYPAKGKPHALKDATVTGAGVRATTNAKGYATTRTTRAGRRAFTASTQGEIRSETLVKVAS